MDIANTRGGIVFASPTTSGPPGRVPLLVRIVGAKSPVQARRAIWAYVFLAPWLIGLTVFWVGPIIASFYFSFTSYDVMSAPTFIGLDNYHKAFFEDELFWPSLLRTFEYSLAVVPLGLAGSLVLAVLLNRGLRGTNIFRTFFFLPSLTPAVALAILWTWLFQPQIGPINLALGTIGIKGPGWMASDTWALPSLVIISLWGAVGGNTMLIFLAGLQGVPESLLDAAEIDGAGPWAKFVHVRIPMISPTILFNLILGVIGALKVFTLAFVATQGGPTYSTWFYALHIYNEAFAYFRMGYGSALAWVFVVVLLIFTWVQLRASSRWVYYAGEEG